MTKAHMRINENETVCGRIVRSSERVYTQKFMYIVEDPARVTCKQCLAKMNH